MAVVQTASCQGSQTGMLVHSWLRRYGLDNISCVPTYSIRRMYAVLTCRCMRATFFSVSSLRAQDPPAGLVCPYHHNESLSERVRRPASQQVEQAFGNVSWRAILRAKKRVARMLMISIRVSPRQSVVMPTSGGAADVATAFQARRKCQGTAKRTFSCSSSANRQQVSLLFHPQSPSSGQATGSSTHCVLLCALDPPWRTHCDGSRLPLNSVVNRACLDGQVHLTRQTGTARPTCLCCWEGRCLCLHPPSHRYIGHYKDSPGMVSISSRTLTLALSPTP